MRDSRIGAGALAREDPGSEGIPPSRRAERPPPEVLLAAVLLLISTAAQAAAPDNDPFARDLLVLTGWFEGEFDNEEQRWFQADPRSNTPEDERHVRVHATHKRIDAPNFGEHVFYVEEYTHDDPGRVYRQRLVIFSSAPEAGGIRMRQGFFHEPERFLGAQHNPACSTTSRRRTHSSWTSATCTGSAWPASSKAACARKPAFSARASSAATPSHNLYLSESKYWRVDSTFLLADDSLHIGMPADQPFELRRAKQFVCNFTFDPRGPEPQEITGLRLHSQGGSFNVTRERDGSEFTVLMRDKEYPYYSTRPDFIYFSIRRKGEQASIAFTVNDPESRALAVNTGEFLASCYREGYEFRESLAALAVADGER